MFSKVAFLLFSICFVKGESDLQCSSKETCSECIQTFGCLWCTQPFSTISNTSSAAHCSAVDTTDLRTWCPSNKIINPTSTYLVQIDQPLQSQSDGNAIQIRPQRVKLSLRRGEMFNLHFHYRQAENYPVDLYYIMDLSASMEEHREKLAKLGGDLVVAMKKLTTNFRLGFGSFVDKTAMPFISTVPSKLKHPCKLKKGTQLCVSPYSFKNHISLTTDAAAFSHEVRIANVSGNLDFPEGGLDAVMQAIVCKKEIGWREKARHLIVFSTDADFHVAGDGKLAGVVEPNDATCHMANDMYTHDLVYDYPSISHINHVAKQNNINIIFAIVKGSSNERVLKLYEQLQQRIENSATSGLTKNSDNVVSLVEENYNKIVDTVLITDNSTNEIEIKYSSNCFKSRENGCSNIHVGEVINFTASIRPLQCQPGPQIIKIKPEGIDESLEVELNVICECPCEKAPHPDFELKSSKCAGEGDLKCGVCNCYPGRFGRSCECDSSSSYTDDISECKQHPDDTDVCSRLGTCKCGICECFKRQSPHELIYGKYCECDNYSCKRFNGQVCSGSEKGVCVCGHCMCLAGWTGEACECSDTNTTCVTPGSGGLVCSGNGKCVCGECQCDVVNGYRYSGKYCEECPTCVGQRCDELRHCVECRTYDTGMYSRDECELKCGNLAIEKVEKIVEETTEDDWKICRSPDNSGCTIVFAYTYDNDKEVVIKAKKDKICSEMINVLAVILGVVGSIVIAGIVMLIVWKACTTIHDKREYEKFESERAKAKWHGDENPLYKKATSEFKNPLYQQ